MFSLSLVLLVPSVCSIGLIYSRFKVIYWTITYHDSVANFDFTSSSCIFVFPSVTGRRIVLHPDTNNCLKHADRKSEDETVCVGGWGVGVVGCAEGDKYSTRNIHTLCPLVHLKKVSSRQGITSGNKEGQVTESGKIEYAAESRGRRIGMNF